jgi:hypothetical protein
MKNNSGNSFNGLPPEGLIIRLKYKLPSLNRLFGLNHWGRHREKVSARRAFESALRAGAAGSSTQIMFARNTSSTSFDMAAYCGTILQTLSNSKSDKRRSEQKKKKKR